MCSVCEWKKSARASAGRLEKTNAVICGSPVSLDDIAQKISGMIDHVDGATYHAVDEINKGIKTRLLALVTEFSDGYARMAEEWTEDRFRGALHIPCDGYRDLRDSTVSAVWALYQKFGARFPWAFYGGYLFMAARPNPSVPERLPELATLLPKGLSWECIDAVWHGLPPATTLYMEVLRIFSEKMGMIPLHGCGCNHYLPPVPDRSTAWKIACPPMSEDRVVEETEVPVAHMLVALENLVRGLPHSLGESSKSIRAHESSGSKALADQRRAAEPPSPVAAAS